MKNIVSIILSPNILSKLKTKEKADFYNCIMQSKELLEEAYQFFNLQMPSLSGTPSSWVKYSEDITELLRQLLGHESWVYAQQEIVDSGTRSVNFERVLLCFNKDNLPVIIRKLAHDNLGLIKEALLSESVINKLAEEAAKMKMEFSIPVGIESDFHELGVSGENEEIFEMD